MPYKERKIIKVVELFCDLEVCNSYLDTYEYDFESEVVQPEMEYSFCRVDCFSSFINSKPLTKFQLIDIYRYPSSDEDVADYIKVYLKELEQDKSEKGE